jgi:hypothetical protein
MNTNFMILGATDQKLWVFEVLRRSLSRAGMCYSQPTRVDHMRKKKKAIGIYKKLHRVRLGHPVAAGGQPKVASRPQPFVRLFPFFFNFLIFFGTLGNGPGEWVYNTPIF